MLLNDSKNDELIRHDFQSFKKELSHYGSLPIVEVQVDKWRTKGERLFMNKWYNFYASHRLTWIEMNEDNPLRGGILNDNNIHFVDKFRDFLQDISYSDLTFIGQMNSCCKLSLWSYYVFSI